MKKYFIIASFLFGFCKLHAQVDLQNTGILYLTGVTDTLYINGSFTNTLSPVAALTNRGQLYVMQNLVNGQVTFTGPTIGTLHLRGSASQTVSGTSPFRTFHLVNDNAAGIVLNNNLSVTGVHTYINGIITTSVTPNYMVYESGSSYVGATDNSHVNGWVKKIGNSNFAFPLGNGTVIRRAAIESLSASLEFNARYDLPTQNATNVQAPLLSVDPNEYWTINRVTGSGSARVHLNWDDSRIVFPEYILSAIRVAYYTGGLWTDVGGSATGDVFTTGDITSNVVSAFGNFTFGSMDFLLPLQFLDITAQRRPGYNAIAWKTASATNTDHFEIERSEDGLHFQKIGSTVSYNSVSAISYSFKDVNQVEGTVWYRVRCIDKDGKFTLSGVVSVKGADLQNQSMYVLNNPARGTIYLYAPATYNGKCEYYITSTGGQLVQKGNLIINGAGNVFIKLDAGISQGVYILSVNKDKQKFQERILIR